MHLRVIFLWLATSLVLSAAAPLREPVPSSRPSPAQQSQIDRKFGMFCHFGINTYVGKQWTDGTVPVERYAPPAELEGRIDEWVRTAREAGMRYFLITAKHHDGFCLWDSKFTDYDVGNPKVKNHLDVVGAVARACKKYEIGFAVYYSLWDRREKFGDEFGDDGKRYLEYTLGQLEELLTNYGPVCEVWFDGSWQRKKAAGWHLPVIYDAIKRWQPDCVVSTNWTIGVPGDPEKRLKPANQVEGAPIRYFPSDFRLGDPDLPKFPDPKNFTYNGKSYYLPFEATVTISSRNLWFYQKEDHHAKSVEALERLFYITTAQDNVLVLNLGPRPDGTFIPAHKQALLELARKLNLGPGKPFPTAPADFDFPYAAGRHPGTCLVGATAVADSVWDQQQGFDAGKAIDGDSATRWAAKDKSATLTIMLKEPRLADTLVLREFGAKGVYRVKQFTVDYFDGTAWQPLLRGERIGERFRHKFSPVTVQQLRVHVTSDTAALAPSLWDVLLLDSQAVK